MTPRKPAVRSRNSSPTRTTYHLMLFKKRERERMRETFVRERTKHREKEIQSPQQKRTHHDICVYVYIQTIYVPIIQNAVKTPTPPHCASFIADAVVGTISTFVEDQCARGMNVFNISLICVVVRVRRERGKMWSSLAITLSL